MGNSRDNCARVFKLRHEGADNPRHFLLQFFLPIIWSLVGSTTLIAISPLVVPFSGLTFIPEGLLLLMGEQFEVFIIKLTGVMAFDLLAILQSDGSGFESLVVVAILSAIGIVVFAILLPFGGGLLDSPGVFVGVMGIRILPDNFLL